MFHALNRQHYHDQQAREFARFFDRVRRHIDDLILEEQVVTVQDDEEEEQNLYGKISRGEFQKIIELYDTQQACPNLQNKPAVSNQPGCNYSKLLFSKPGFHHVGSTSFLVQELGIKDVERDSYLGGHSSYSLQTGEDLKALKENRVRQQILERIPHLYRLIENNKLDEAEFEIENLFKRDFNNGDLLAVRARCLHKRKRYTEALEDYFMALDKYKPTHRSTIEKNFAESLFEQAMIHFRAGKYELASEVFSRSLALDPTQANSKLHLEMCQQKIARARCLPDARRFQHRG